MSESDRGGVSLEAPRERWLVFGYGNPSRGDDALGPLFVEHARTVYERHAGTVTIDFLTDFQLQVEHALDITGCDRVFFVDASVACAEPFEEVVLAPEADRTLSSHMLSPQALLHVYRSVTDQPMPPASLLAIRGHSFELGEELTASAARNLEQAIEYFEAQVKTGGGLI